MDTAAQVLLIIVSATLTVFLAVLIITFIYITSLVKQLKRITQRAENVAESVESAANVFEKSAGPIAVLKLLSNIVDGVTKARRGKGKKG